MEKREISKYKDEEFEPVSRHYKTGSNVWKTVGGIALLGLASLIVVSLPDIKRYIKISTIRVRNLSDPFNTFEEASSQVSANVENHCNTRLG
jgi:hypothetical protein